MSASPYRPIDSAHGEIRRLVLHPASKRDAEIVCELEPVRLSANPEFEALSYSWGSVGQATDIRLSGHKMQAWENCAAALRCLRLPKKKRLLWIDALCINQDDLGERSEQVLLMQQIYSQAQQVCVWLGELTEGGAIGMMQLQDRLLAVGWEQLKLDRKYGRPLLSFKENIGSAAGIMNRSNLVQEQMNGEVREILDRPWWRRTWIIQEAVLAGRIVLMCGPETVSWESVDELKSRQFWTQARVEVFGVPANPKDFFPDQIYRIISDYREKWRRSPTEINLFDVMYRFRLLECTDPRDRIYGFLGIVPSVVKLGIVPDYRSTTRKVYLDFARKAIQGTRTLDVLNCKREWQGCDTQPDSGQAYSVIDQSRYYDVHAQIVDGPGKKPRRGWARLPDGWERIPSGKVSFFQDHNTGELHEKSPLEGQPPRPAEYHTKQRFIPPGWSRKWNNVGRAVVAYGVEETQREAEIRQKTAELRREMAQMPSWVPIWAFSVPWDPMPLIDWTQATRQYWAAGDTVPYLHSTPNSYILSLDGKLCDEIQYLAPAWHPAPDKIPPSRQGIDSLISWEALGSVEVESCPYAADGGRKNALWRTMIADFAGEQAAPAEDWAFVEAWYDRVGWAKELPNLTSLGPWDNGLQEGTLNSVENDMVEHFFTLRPLAFEGVRDALKQSFTEPRRIIKSYGEYMRRIYRACAHRALFVTRRGYIGLAPWNSREGDRVAVLYGGATPYVFRQSPVTGRFALVGEAYVYGMMAGEALDGKLADELPTMAIHLE
ncbi:uncharacterized protein E0L32_002490 [Thyridium curvatum]|uniref:Heterokaryon incompatibility domain-containing protein n=1 Tax=Thyridium curvatum TaxID=1093900 RepID=A0A507BGL2_9PEZI|nr:uncharacterized protein E0L32_002490 [Thyridium curvatum]TPX18633.1 hypothetical protein E0L32_002490 [Thyridium curvatum]